MPDYDTILDFSRKLFKNANINTYVADTAALKELELDLGLRRKIAADVNSKSVSLHLLKECTERVLCFTQDRFYCRYAAFLLPDTTPTRFFVAGPYIFREADNSFFMKLIQELSIPREFHKFLKQYYTQVPAIEYSDQLRSLFLLLASEIFGGAEGFSVLHRDFYEEDTGSEYFTSTPASLDNREMIEERYRQERDLMQAVATGNLEQIEFFTSNTVFQLEQRFTNRIRNAKNYLIVLNTLLRKAAEYGGVHPLYIDDISSRFAREIELITSESDENRLRHEMMRKYGLMVKTHSLKGYSPLIRKVITHITLSLAEDLSLSALSKLFSISPSYLSALFKKETGTTLTDFVNRKRIENSVFLLNSTDLHIQTIGLSCGIADLNYFTRLFKKYMGRTPSEYREMILQK